MAFFRRIRRYTEGAMALHWLVALGIAFLYIHGFSMMDIPADERLHELNVHRSVGVVVFLLVVVRVWWRRMHPPPAVPMPPFQAGIAHFVHFLIYVLLVVNGIAGSVGWWASGDPIVFFGFDVAPERTPWPRLNHACILVGLGTARVLLAVVALHVLAVVKHEWLDRDRLLERMLPGPAILVPLRPREIVERMRERRRKRGEQKSGAQAAAKAPAPGDAPPAD